MRIGLSIYSYTFSAGYLRPLREGQPLDVFGLMAKAEAAGLAGVEFDPLRALGGSPAELRLARRYADERGLFIVADTGGTDPNVLRRALQAAAELGSPVLRTTFSRVLAGDRRALAAEWPRLLETARDQLRQVLPEAERLGVCIAIENHQDLTAGELIWLMQELDSPWVGVTLDTGNPLGVGEEPLAFAKAILPYLRHVHLKDYKVYLTPSGYRLVRCPLGHGVIDFPALRELFASAPHPLTPTVEIGALQARHVRVLEDDFWPGYPPREAAALAAALRLCWRGARPADEPWQTPWEAEADETAIRACEEAAVADSLPLLRQLFGLSLPRSVA